MLEDYKNALKSGQRAYRACVARGQSPYLAVLDDILNGVNIVAQEPLGLVDIPAESIVGTKTSGRHTAFAANFMPLLEEDTEFAIKWSNLCEAHLEEGIHTPIIAYEFLNKFYVQEGNKRVSVLKYFDAVRIAGTVTRLVPERNETLENKIYYEFLDFYKLSKINNVQFSRLGGYAKLQTLVCKAASEVWSDDDRLNFSALYTMFSQQFYALGGSALELTPGDALLVYLSVYRYSDACQSTPSQVRENLAKLWDEIKILTEPHAVTLSLEPNSASEPLLSKLNIFSQKPSQLKVVFLHEHNAENSAWVRAHDKGIEALQQAFPDRVFITRKENIEPEVDAEQIIIGAGTEQLYSMLVQLLGRDRLYGVEDPGYSKAARIYALGGARTAPVLVDEGGVSLRSLEMSGAQILHTSPNHQFPTGAVTPSWFSTNFAVEASTPSAPVTLAANASSAADDYDSEFRFTLRPIPTLQSIDRAGRVIYVNTFSRTLAPSLRISYMVLPKSLTERYRAQLGFYSSTVPAMEQYTLARFLDEGYFEAHINRMRKSYRAQRDAVIDTILQSPLGEHCRVSGEDAGLHFLLTIDTKCTDHVLRADAEGRGVRLSFLSDFALRPGSAPQHTLVIHYPGIDLGRLRSALSILEALLYFRDWKYKGRK